MKSSINKYIFIVPPIQIIITLIICFIDVEYLDFVKLGNSFGYSITTSIVYVAFFCFNKKYCFFTKAASFSLLIIAVFNFISSFFFNQDDYMKYELLFSKVVVLICLTLVSIITLTTRK